MRPIAERNVLENDRPLETRHLVTERHLFHLLGVLEKVQQSTVLIEVLQEASRYLLQRHQHADRLDQQDSHYEKLDHIERQVQYGKIETKGQSGPDHGLLQFACELAHVVLLALAFRHLAGVGFKEFRKAIGAPHGPERLDADHGVRKAGGKLTHVFVVTASQLSATLHELAEGIDHEDADYYCDQRQRRRDQHGDQDEHGRLQDARYDAGHAEETLADSPCLIACCMGEATERHADEKGPSRTQQASNQQQSEFAADFRHQTPDVAHDADRDNRLQR